MPSQNIKNIQFDDKISIGVEIIPVDKNYVAQSANLTTAHRASFYCILWFQEGYPTHQVDFVPIKVRPGSLLFVGKDSVQFFDQTNNFKAKVLLFTDAFFCKNDNDIKYLNRTPLFHTFDSSLQCILSVSEKLNTLWTFMEHEEKAPHDRFKPILLRNYLESFLLQAERTIGDKVNTPSANENYKEIFFSFKELAEKHFKEQKPVSYYSEKLYISAKVLSRTTQKLSGKTPKHILDERLLLEAKRLLMHDTSAGKEIGYSLGFTEPTNFIKFFRKHAGKTPLAFRAHYRQSKGQ
ncbi:MAG: helix-turn-helix domain-containing protein [Arachidicoccus sp.]|nr:helix-turn-helix domain-containing protein [Arachidicoccus sp.]